MEKFTNKYMFKKIQDDGAYVSKEAGIFCRDFKAMLKRTLKDKGINVSSFSMGHYDLSGFCEKGGRYVYFSYNIRDAQESGLSCLNFTDDTVMKGVLVRTAKHLKDYTGGRNHFCSVIELPETIEEVMLEA